MRILPSLERYTWPTGLNGVWGGHIGLGYYISSVIHLAQAHSCVCVSPEEKDLHPIMFIWFPLLLSEQHQTTQVASGGKHATPSPKGWVLGDSPLLWSSFLVLVLGRVGRHGASLAPILSSFWCRRYLSGKCAQRATSLMQSLWWGAMVWRTQDGGLALKMDSLINERINKFAVWMSRMWNQKLFHWIYVEFYCDSWYHVHSKYLDDHNRWKNKVYWILHFFPRVRHGRRYSFLLPFSWVCPLTEV